MLKIIVCGRIFLLFLAFAPVLFGQAATPSVTYQITGALPGPLPLPRLPIPVLISFTTQPTGFNLPRAISPQDVDATFNGKKLVIQAAHLVFHNNYPATATGVPTSLLQAQSSEYSSGGLFDLTLVTTSGTLTIVADGSNALENSQPVLGRLPVRGVFIYWLPLASKNHETEGEQQLFHPAINAHLANPSGTAL